jgi:hypothetical protein
MLHPVVIDTLVQDRQARFLDAADASRRLAHTPHPSSALQDWARWWFAARTHGRPVTPSVPAHDGYMTAPG